MRVVARHSEHERPMNTVPSTTNIFSDTEEHI
jgi:hypothetical protein